MTLNLLVDFLRKEKHLPISGIGFEIFNQEIIHEFANWLSTSRGCGISTQNNRIAALRSFFHYAGMTDISLIALEQEISKVPIKKEKGRVVNFLSENALKALLETPDIKTKTGMRNRFYMILMYDTAGRCQELLDLKLKDFVISGSKPYVYLTGKNSKQRSVPLLPKTVGHYEHYLAAFHPEPNLPDDYVFYTVSHNQRHQMSEDNVGGIH